MCECCGVDVIKMILWSPSCQKYRANASHHHQMYQICINNFLTAYIQLKPPGKSISDSNVLSLFLSGIIDPDFQITVRINQNNDGNLMDAVINEREKKRNQKMKSREINQASRKKPEMILWILNKQ